MGEIERKLFTRHVCTLLVFVAKRELVEWNPDGPSNRKQWPSEKQKDHPSWTGPAPRSPIDFNYELPGHKRNLNITDKFEKFHNWFPRRLCRSSPLPFDGTRTVKRDEGRRGGRGEDGGGGGKNGGGGVRGQNEEQRDKNKGTLHSRMSDRKDWRFSFRDILQRTDTFVSAGNRRFFFSLLARSASRSIVLGYGLKGNSCPGRNSERNDSMIPVCVCVLFKTCFRVFLRLIVRNVSVDRAKDLSTIQSSRRKETRLSDF